jgi:hypothetical protein
VTTVNSDPSHAESSGPADRPLLPVLASVRVWFLICLVVLALVVTIATGVAVGGLGGEELGRLIVWTLGLAGVAHMIVAPVAAWSLRHHTDSNRQEWLWAVIIYTPIELGGVVVLLRWLSSPFPV